MAWGRGMDEDGHGKGYKEPHQKNAGWTGWELDKAAHHLHHARKISSNPKFMKAVEEHLTKKAHEHHETAKTAHMLAKAGRISTRQLDKLDRIG